MQLASEQQSEIVSQKPAPRKPSRKSVGQWQQRLLPIMASMLIGLSLIFFAATLIQLAYLNQRIAEIPDIQLPDLSLPVNAVDDGATADLAARKLEVVARLEAYLIEQRYHQASVLLMSGLWTRYLGFVTGMILALVGASFILGKLQEETTELAGEGSGLAVTLKTTSPGLVLAVLGTILMFATIINRDTYETKDAAVYLSGWTEDAAGTDMAPPVPPTPMP